MLRGTALAAAYYGWLNKYLVPCCLSLRLKANHLSFLGLLFGLGAGIAFGFSPFWGGLLTLVSGFLDTLDGALARELHQEKRQGAFLDSVLDRYGECFILVGIWVYFLRKSGAIPLITLTLFLVLFGSFMVSYTKARAEGLQVSCSVGLFQRGERIITIGVAGLVNSLVNFAAPTSATSLAGQDYVLVAALIVLAAGTNLTALRRILHVVNKLRSKPG